MQVFKTSFLQPSLAPARYVFARSLFVGGGGGGDAVIDYKNYLTLLPYLGSMLFVSHSVNCRQTRNVRHFASEAIW